MKTELLEEAAPSPGREVVAPLLDVGLATLSHKDRDAVVLRYLKQQSLEIGFRGVEHDGRSGGEAGLAGTRQAPAVLPERAVRPSGAAVLAEARLREQSAQAAPRRG